ncbi:MAG: tetratricopeptide repeat protein [Treponema sp.]|jgi:predicted Zn-dependent protease|nr:tetratricopeptide repeat protein [Treponema sp.]
MEFRLPAGDSPPVAALALRSFALYGVLWQFRFLAGDVADTAVFAASLAAGFAVPAVLAAMRFGPPGGGGENGKNAALPLRNVPALIILAFIPWTARALIAFSGFFAADAAAVFDSLLLGFDRNNFVSLFPYYWAALFTWFSARSRFFLRFDIIAAQLLLLVFYCLFRTAAMEAYRWPVTMIVLFTAIVLFQLLALVFSMPAEYLVRRGERVRAAAVLVVLALAAGLLMIRPSQERALERGGGLLQPNLFRFDFSHILKLQSEIRVNDDLILIVRKESQDHHIYLRRFILSGYSERQGFYRHEEKDEIDHPQKLPEVRTRVDGDDVPGGRFVGQEYFLVNFDASAFIAINQPREIIPYESWDASSFNSAYGVTSYVSDIPAGSLAANSPRRSLPPDNGGQAGVSGFTAGDFGMDEKEYAYYTEYGGDGRIAAYAGELSRDYLFSGEMAQAVYDRLRHGEYRYSLKPGIAPDGDQLAWFLYESKRGYCSYFAFAMALMLRSLGIPARVAVGFFLDQQSGVFDYYPIRSDMAHAWVEVYYPGYGWIDYDPTTTQFAEDEEFNFSNGVPPELFERLIKEILENRSRMNAKQGISAEEDQGRLNSIGGDAVSFLRKNGAVLLLTLVVFLFLFLRCGYLVLYCLFRNPRKKAVRLWSHARRRLALAGFRRGGDAGEAEWARSLDGQYSLGLYPLYGNAAAARFSRVFLPEELRIMRENYREFSGRYGKTVSLFRRFLAWALPPLAMAAGRRGPGRRNGRGQRNGPSGGNAGKIPVVLLTVLLFVFSGDSAPSEEPGELLTADGLLEAAAEAQERENWELAIRFYTEGEGLFPGDPRFPLTLGALYYSRELYHLAWDEYRKAEAIVPDDPYLLYNLSRTAGYLNRDAVSAGYLERLLVIDPENQDAIGTLGWMYYKLHRLNDGERLLLDAVSIYGREPDFAMTLGTIYSDMFRYDDAKYWYLRAIAESEELNNREFTAVAHYNLSILESRYYRYADAFERTNSSLSAQNRSSGRLARGEIYLRRMELPRALSDYQAAYQMDTSPLSKVNLAQAFQMAGRLEEARLYAEDCLESGDLSWMLNYGIDVDRYRRDLHEILYKTYSGLARTEKRKIYAGFPQKIRGVYMGWYYAVKSVSHHYLYKKYSLNAARAYDAESSNNSGGVKPLNGSVLSEGSYGAQGLDSQIQYYNAFESYPRRAYRYLRNARQFEVPLIPLSEFSYIAEEGYLFRDAGLLERVIPLFDPAWERDMIADTYAKLYRLLDKKLPGKERDLKLRDAAERLYALNQGALRQNGIRLPVELLLDTSRAASPGRTERALRKALKKMGIEAARPGEGGNRYRLSIAVSGGEAFCELYDGGRGTSFFREFIPLLSLKSAALSEFAAALGDAVFVGFE